MLKKPAFFGVDAHLSDELGLVVTEIEVNKGEELERRRAQRFQPDCTYSNHTGDDLSQQDDCFRQARYTDSLPAINGENAARPHQGRRSLARLRICIINPANMIPSNT